MSLPLVYRFLLCHCYLILVVCNQGSIETIHVPAEAGQNVTITCNMTNTLDCCTTGLWRSYEEKWLLPQNCRYCGDRFSVTENLSHDISVLQIKNISKSDVGIYVCQCDVNTNIRGCRTSNLRMTFRNYNVIIPDCHMRYEMNGERKDIYATFGTKTKDIINAKINDTISVRCALGSSKTNCPELGNATGTTISLTGYTNCKFRCKSSENRNVCNIVIFLNVTINDTLPTYSKPTPSKRNEKGITPTIHVPAETGQDVTISCNMTSTLDCCTRGMWRTYEEKWLLPQNCRRCGDRFSVTENLSHDISVLHIKNISKSDVGMYVCQCDVNTNIRGCRTSNLRMIIRNYNITIPDCHMRYEMNGERTDIYGSFGTQRSDVINAKVNDTISVRCILGSSKTKCPELENAPAATMSLTQNNCKFRCKSSDNKETCTIVIILNVTINRTSPPMMTSTATYNASIGLIGQP